MPPAALLVGSGQGMVICHPHSSFVLPGQQARGATGTEAISHQSTVPACHTTTTPPVAFSSESWLLGEPFSHPPLPHNMQSATAAPTPCRGEPDTKVPERAVEAPPCMPPSSPGLCTLSSTCGRFEDALGDLSWGGQQRAASEQCPATQPQALPVGSRGRACPGSLTCSGYSGRFCFSSCAADEVLGWLAGPASLPL